MNLKEWTENYIKSISENNLVEKLNTLLEKNVPNDPSKWSYYKSQAKEKFDVYPSAYANAWAAKKYKAAGGTWKKESVNESQITITKQDMDRLHSGEEVDIDGNLLKFVDESVNEAMDKSQLKKIYNNLQKGDEITIGYSSVMGGKSVGEFIVTKGKTKVGKARVERITLINKKNPRGVKYYLYQRNGFVTFAIGNLGAVINSITLKESVNESNDYFRTASQAVDYARKMIEKRGFEIDEDDWQRQIALGGRYGRFRPGKEKSTEATIGLLKNGKPQRKALQISLYGMPSGNYELTYYVN
jgi:hypothetical protein